MNNWESILDQYLCGEGSRADVESLRLRLTLAAEEREEIEGALRLVDEICAAFGTVAVPKGAAERLSESFQSHATQNVCESLPRWVWDGSTYRNDPMVLRPTPVMDEESVAYAMIEGEAGSNSQHTSDAGLQQVLNQLSDPSAKPALPAGAENRLLSRLRPHMQSEAEQMDPSVARRILRQLQECPLPSIFSDNVPDVLAATTDADEKASPPKPPETK